MPTPSCRAEARSRRAAIAATACAAALWLPASALAHDPGAYGLPEDPGWRLGGAVALLGATANERWPTAEWPGVMVTGVAPEDWRHVLKLEHAEIGGALRVNRYFGLRASVGWHGSDSAQVESARLEGGTEWAEGRLTLGIGRDRVGLGPVIDRAGNFDRFSQPPLVKRAVLNGDWIDDGATVSWTRLAADGLRAVEAGIWRGHEFPGGPAGPAVPSLRLQAGWGHADFNLSVARFKPTGRGTAVASAGESGHVHGTLDCRNTLQQMVCFDGDVDVATGSAQWTSDDERWTFALAGMLRRDRGSLYSINGFADLDLHITGFWADAIWTPLPRWSVAMRLERLVPDSRLEGFGVARLAREAGLVDGGPVNRASLAVLYGVWGDIQLSVEAGYERFQGGSVSHVALRAVWANPWLLAGGW